MTCYAAPEDEAAAALTLGGDGTGTVAERDCPWRGHGVVAATQGGHGDAYALRLPAAASLPT